MTWRIFFFLHQLSKFIWIHLSPDLGLLKICAPTKNNIPLFICFVFLSVFCLARKTLGQLAANYLQKIATETWYDLFVFLCVLLSAARYVQYVLWLRLYACVHAHPHAPVNTTVSLGPIVLSFYICGSFSIWRLWQWNSDRLGRGRNWKTWRKRSGQDLNLGPGVPQPECSALHPRSPVGLAHLKVRDRATGSLTQSASSSSAASVVAAVTWCFSSITSSFLLLDPVDSWLYLTAFLHVIPCMHVCLQTLREVNFPVLYFSKQKYSKSRFDIQVQFWKTIFAFLVVQVCVCVFEIGRASCRERV